MHPTAITTSGIAAEHTVNQCGDTVVVVAPGVVHPAAPLGRVLTEGAVSQCRPAVVVTYPAAPPGQVPSEDAVGQYRPATVVVDDPTAGVPAEGAVVYCRPAANTVYPPALSVITVFNCQPIYNGIPIFAAVEVETPPPGRRYAKLPILFSTPMVTRYPSW